ncbi:hypothetical protein AVEN_64528-1 [Araneus ventricosus]|uniref:Uncharacterized protein n=1 Tax=Araneus ventricosus TaxID=182803 RepID=A0A4Y2GK10_ARAVE|nr:hypothetical protein AVEN_64528-1 [Araneus ventricosus]
MSILPNFQDNPNFPESEQRWYSEEPRWPHRRVSAARLEGLVHLKSVESKRHPASVVRYFGDLGAVSSIVLVI